MQTVGLVVVTPTSATIYFNGSTSRTVQLSATAYAENTSGGGVLTNAPVVWSSSQPQTATVSPTGFVTAIAEGTAIITATSGSKSATSTVSVKKR